MACINSRGLIVFEFLPSMMQPDSPADLGNKIYEMMAMALGGRWGRLEEGVADAPQDDAAESSVANGETSETQVVEPSEVRTENDPWSD